MWYIVHVTFIRRTGYLIKTDGAMFWNCRNRTRSLGLWSALRIRSNGWEFVSWGSWIILEGVVRFCFERAIVWRCSFVFAFLMLLNFHIVMRTLFTAGLERRVVASREVVSRGWEIVSHWNHSSTSKMYNKCGELVSRLSFESYKFCMNEIIYMYCFDCSTCLLCGWTVLLSDYRTVLYEPIQVQHVLFR